MRHFRFSGRRDSSNNESGSATGSSTGIGGDADTGNSGMDGSEQVRLRKYCRYGTFAWSREVVPDRPRLAELENTFFGKRITVLSQIGVTTPSPDDPTKQPEFLQTVSIPSPQPEQAVIHSDSSSIIITREEEEGQSDILQTASLEETRTGAVSMTKKDSLKKVGRTATVPVPKPTRLSLTISPRSRHSGRSIFGKGYVTAYLSLGNLMLYMSAFTFVQMLSCRYEQQRPGYH